MTDEEYDCENEGCEMMDLKMQYGDEGDLLGGICPVCGKGYTSDQIDEWADDMGEMMQENEMDERRLQERDNATD